MTTIPEDITTLQELQFFLGRESFADDRETARAALTKLCNAFQFWDNEMLGMLIIHLTMIMSRTRHDEGRAALKETMCRLVELLAITMGSGDIDLDLSADHD